MAPLPHLKLKKVTVFAAATLEKTLRHLLALCFCPIAVGNVSRSLKFTGFSGRQRAGIYARASIKLMSLAAARRQACAHRCFARAFCNCSRRPSVGGVREGRACFARLPLRRR